MDGKVQAGELPSDSPRLEVRRADGAWIVSFKPVACRGSTCTIVCLIRKERPVRDGLNAPGCCRIGRPEAVNVLNPEPS